MNIKILEPMPENLVLETVPFGSRVYGTHCWDSDYDYIKILKVDCGSLVLQYSTCLIEHEKPLLIKQVDYVYTDLNNFMDCLKKGGNTAFFEAAHLMPRFKDSIMEFYNYESAKMYLGYAKRDLSYPDRQHHVARCIYMAEQIMKQERIDFEHVKDIKPIIGNLGSYIKALRDELNQMYKKV